jgi:hypothetical protein
MTNLLIESPAIAPEAWFPEVVRKLHLIDDAIGRNADDEIATHCRWLRGGATAVGANLILDVANAIEITARFVEPARAKSLIADALDFALAQAA